MDLSDENPAVDVFGVNDGTSDSIGHYPRYGPITCFVTSQSRRCNRRSDWSNFVVYCLFVYTRIYTLNYIIILCVYHC